MTKPRTNPNRLLFGIIGSVDDVSACKKRWNGFFREQGIDGFMDSYPTKENEIPERLSEMFHFDRRGYIVGKPLQKAIIPYLDRVAGQPTPRLRLAGKGSVGFVVNDDGVLVGYPELSDEEMWSLWLAVEEGTGKME